HDRALCPADDGSLRLPCGLRSRSPPHRARRGVGERGLRRGLRIRGAAVGPAGCAGSRRHAAQAMNLAGVLVFLLSATAAGYALLRFVSGGLTRTETVAWSFVAGWLVQSAVLLVILAAGGIPGPRKILGAEALVIAASFAVRRPVRIPMMPLTVTQAPAWLRVLAAVLIA